MAAPSRHILLTGLPGILLVHYFPHWWAWVVGGLAAFFGHTLVDLLCNEYWDRTKEQDVILAVACLFPVITVSCYFVSPVFGWPLLLIMAMLSLGQDIVDGINELVCKNQGKLVKSIFPNHWTSPYYIPPLTPEESFSLTISMEVGAGIILGLVAYFVGK